MEKGSKPERPTAPPRQRNATAENSCEDSLVRHFNELCTTTYQLTTEAQALDGQGAKEAAFREYQKALMKIDEALNTRADITNATAEVEDTTYKLRITRKSILERVADLQNCAQSGPDYLAGPSCEPSGLPSYSEACPCPYSNLNSALEEIAQEQNQMPNPLPLNATEVFSIANNQVQIYFISEGFVSAPSSPSFLRVVSVEANSESELSSNIPAFLQVGPDWTYPLVPQQSPVLRSEDGAYIFPDFSPGAQAGNSVGLIFGPEVTDLERETFEDILSQLLGLSEFPAIASTPGGTKTLILPTPTPSTEPKRLSTTISKGLVQGAEAVKRGLEYGSAKTSTFLDKSTAYLQTKIQPVSQQPEIKPEVKTGLKHAKYVTGKAVKLSGFVVSQVGNATLALGGYLAPKVHSMGTKLVASASGSNEQEASKKVEQVLEVGNGAIIGFSTVYQGLENSAKILASSLANNTVQVVEHRYGTEAREVAADTAATVGNAAMTAWNAKSLAPKSVAKQVVKKTGKTAIQQFGKSGDRDADQ